MANGTIASLMVRIGGDISDLEKALSRASRKMQDAGKQMSALGRTMSTRITAPLAAVGGIALKTSADFESLRQSMNVLNGSVEEGARNFERLKQFSAQTPFQLGDLARAQNTLQGFSLSADEAFESISMIGDIAAVTGGDIQGIAVAFGQAAAEGKLMTQDIRQLINQGVPAVKLLADTMNVAESEVFDLASQGEISFEIMQQAFRDATSEGGMFADGMKQQAGTLGGVWSTMTDNVSIALASLGDVMSDLAKGVISQVTNLAQAFSDLNEGTKQMIVTAGLLVAAIGPAVFILGKLMVVLGALISPIGLVVAGIAGLIVIGKNLYDNWELIAAELTNLWDGIKVAAWTIVAGISEAFGWMADGILGTLSSMAAALQPSLVGPLEFARSQIEAATDAINEKLEESKDQFDRSGEAAVEARDNMTSLSDSFWSITDAIQNGIGAGLGWLSDTIFPKVTEETDKLTIATRKLGNALNIPQGELKKVEGNTDSVAVALGKTKEQAEIMGEALQSTVSSAITSFGETLGNVFTGDAGASGFFNNILLVVADFGKQLGRMLVAAGVAAQAFQSLIANPVAAIIAGGALIAASTAVSNLLKKGPETPELAQGGLAFGPTLAVVGDNPGVRSDPEVIAPLSKLQGMMGGSQKVEVFGQIRGEDIYISSNRGGSSYNR